MKKIISVYCLLVSSLIFSQNNITNTLGTGGIFTIKDGSTIFFTLNQSDGRITLPVTTSASLGVIFKGANSFIHDFAPANALGGNTFIGINSGNFTMAYSSGSDASYNTGVGLGSLSSLTTGHLNTAIGYYSLNSNTTGYENTASGYGALSSNTTGFGNTALGVISLSGNSTGYQNVAVGSYSLYLNSTGYQNTASGYKSLYSNSTGNRNTATGEGSLQNNTTGNDNSAIGLDVLYSNSTGSQNTASGLAALYSNTTGSGNTALGYNSLSSNTTGFQNTSVGHHSLQNNTGNYNTALGYNAGSTITTGSNLTCIGIDAAPNSPTATNQITLGNTFVTSLRCATTTITSLSDARDKKNIKDLNLGIDFLMKIKPRLYNWDKREWYENNKSDGSKMKEEPTAGFIAQELDEVQTKENAEWLNLVLKDNPEKWEATPGNLLPIIVKAIQDLKKENDELKSTNVELTSKLSKFEQTLNLLVAEIERLKTNNNATTKVSLGEK
jgi:hypothetical protein